MTLYARADVMSVSVPVTSGGCGEVHSRPVVAGAPVKLWKLDCPACETDLKQDIARSGSKKVRTVNSDNGLKLADRYLGMWGTRHEMVPETYDEEVERIYAEQETSKHQAQNQSDSFKTISDAIAMLAAQGQGNNALVQALAQALAVKQEAAPAPDPVPAAPVVAATSDPACKECGKPVVRISLKGPPPSRCPDCKAKRAA